MAEEVEKSKYLPLYYSYIEQLRLLTPEQAGRLIMALLEHGRDGAEPDFPRDSNLYMAFSFIADNAQRAENRGLELLEKRRAAGRKGGIASAQNAQRNERGEFVSSDPSKTQAKPKQTQAPKQVQAYNNNHNHNDNDNHNRRLPHVREDGGRDDEREKILQICETAVGGLDAAERGMILTACAGMDAETVEKAVQIAMRYGARSAAYLAKSIRTQREKPEREARADPAVGAGRGILSARRCPRTPEGREMI